MFYQESAPHRRDRHEDTDARPVLMVEETPVVGFLPYGKPWTRRAPSFDDFRVGARIRTNPFEQVKDQGFERIGHRFLLISSIRTLHQPVEIVPIMHPFVWPKLSLPSYARC